MKNILKISTRIVAAFAVCAALSACAQPAAFSSNFPTYGGQTGTGGFVPPSIMDY